MVFRMPRALHSETLEPRGRRGKKGIAEGGITEAFPGYEIGRTSPLFHLLLYTTKGQGRIRSTHSHCTVGGEEVLIIPAGTPFNYKPYRGAWSFVWFHLMEMEQWARLRERDLLVHSTTLGPPLEKSMVEFLHESHGTSLYSPRAAGLHAELLALYIERELRRISVWGGSDVQVRLDKLWDEVNEDPARTWSVEMMARELHVSAPHLHRLVQASTGTSPMKMVTRLRMERAQDLLIILACKISAVAEMVGYQNEFAFSVAFKRFSGVTPSEFRQRR
jgi:AraC-like DNA-binding protein